MFHVTDKPVRWAALLLMAVSLMVSASRVVHAHVEGAHAHRLGTPCGDDQCPIEPVAWHAHVWLFGLEVHLPLAADEGRDPSHPPGDISPSWSVLPTVVEAQPLVAFDAEWVALDGVPARIVMQPLEVGDACPPHSGLSPGAGQRIWMSSLTL